MDQRSGAGDSRFTGAEVHYLASCKLMDLFRLKLNAMFSYFEPRFTRLSVISLFTFLNRVKVGMNTGSSDILKTDF